MQFYTDRNSLSAKLQLKAFHVGGQWVSKLRKTWPIWM